MRPLKLLVLAAASVALAAGVAAAASSPSVATKAASKIKTSSAVLNGSVDPNGAPTAYSFQWGLTNSYGETSRVKPAGKSTSSVKASVTASGLLPGTVYHYRIGALNKYGGALGADRTFKTAGNPPPDAATGPASQIGTSFATVTGVVNPQGAATTWMFQYGLSTAYSSQTVGGSVPAGSAPVTVSEQIQGLAPGTIFHYRIVAVHGSSVAQDGADATFMTYPSPRPRPRITAQTKPKHAHARPFVFSTSGRIRAPASIPASFSCFGDVAVKFFLGTRQVNYSLFVLQPNCTFSGQTTFRHLPGPHRKHHKKITKVTLHVLVHWRGNGYLAPTDAHLEKVVLGR